MIRLSFNFTEIVLNAESITPTTIIVDLFPRSHENHLEHNQHLTEEY